jgi:hypothetical protein
MQMRAAFVTRGLCAGSVLVTLLLPAQALAARGWSTRLTEVTLLEQGLNWRRTGHAKVTRATCRGLRAASTARYSQLVCWVRTNEPHNGKKTSEYKIRVTIRSDGNAWRADFIAYTPGFFA